MDDEKSNIDEELESLRVIFEDLFGEQATDLILEQINKNPDEYLRSPRTWQAKMQDLVEEHAKVTTPDVIEERFVEHLSELMKLGSEALQNIHAKDEELVRNQPAALAAEDTVVRIAGDTDPQRVLAALGEAWGLSDELIERGVFPSMKLLLHGSELDDITFEESTNATASALLDFAELHYKKVISSLYRITQLAEDNPASPPNTLGALMARCRRSWSAKHPDLLPLLDDRVRVVRNSEGHRNTAIDPRTETVTFINKRSDGTEERLRFDRNQFADFVSDFTRLSLGLDAVFRRAGRRISG